jgi:AbrB family looped-hinge helix DNA binding protein
MPVVKLSSKGQLVIPKKIREALGIKPRQKILLKLVEDHAEIEPLPEDPIQYLCGIFKDHPVSLTAELLKDREEDKRREEKKSARFIRHPRLPEAGTSF